MDPNLALKVTRNVALFRYSSAASFPKKRSATQNSCRSNGPSLLAAGRARSGDADGAMFKYLVDICLIVSPQRSERQRNATLAPEVHGLCKFDPLTVVGSWVANPRWVRHTGPACVAYV